MGSYDPNPDPDQPKRPSLADFDRRASPEPIWWQTRKGQAAALFWIVFAAGIIADRLTTTDATPYWRIFAAWLWPLPFALVADRIFRGPINWQEKRDRRHQKAADEAWRRKPVKDRISYLSLWAACAIVFCLYLATGAAVWAAADTWLALGYVGQTLLGLALALGIPIVGYLIWASYRSR